MNQKQNKYVAHILEGKKYSAREIPAWWKNETYLPYFFLHIATSQVPSVDPIRLALFSPGNAIDLDRFPCEKFPLVEDFEVILWGDIQNDTEESELQDYSLCFFSVQRGFLADFDRGPYTVQDLLTESFHIPCGDFAFPYFELEQGWVLLIAEKENFVYILTGSFEQILEKRGYHTWFKVEKQRYYSQWAKAIDIYQRKARQL